MSENFLEIVKGHLSKIKIEVYKVRQSKWKKGQEKYVNENKIPN